MNEHPTPSFPPRVHSGSTNCQQCPARVVGIRQPLMFDPQKHADDVRGVIEAQMSSGWVVTSSFVVECYTFLTFGRGESRPRVSE